MNKPTYMQQRQQRPEDLAPSSSERPPEQKDALDLQAFAFPKLSAIDAAFSTLRTDPALLAEAKRRGFYNGNGPYNKLFSTLFFKGGKVNFQPGISNDFRLCAWPYCRALMCSFEPPHEEKEAVCAMLLSELALL